MSWKKHFRPTNSVLPSSNLNSGGVGGGSTMSKFSSWLPEFYQGPPNRLQRYSQYDQMDFDHDVHSALDTISDFSTQFADDQYDSVFKLKYLTEPSEVEEKILKETLQQWTELNEFQKRLFKIFRSTLKFGDQVFVRDPETFKLMWGDLSTVERVLVNESTGKEIEVYFIKNLDFNLQSSTVTDMSKKSSNGYGSADSIFPNAPITGQANHMHGSSVSTQGGNLYGQGDITFPVDAAHVVHLSLTEGMDDAWPFGVSILEKVFKVYKQKELLEDSIIIYRVHRAPERRVFFIDTGTMPPQKAQQYLERVRYEVQQKRIPSRTGGGENIMDSAYNPLSSLEDYYFSQTSDGRGSKVETLPGGENLGEIDDLRMWNMKMFRALGIPSSYLPTGTDDGSASYNDGRIGTAFIQEFRFNTECQRLQKQIIGPLDLEFKLFLKHRGIQIDSGVFNIEFNPPQSFSQYRQIEIDSAHASVYSQLEGIPHLSRRFALKKYLGGDDEDIIENERRWKEEHPDSDTSADKSEQGDLRQVGVMGGDFGNFEDPDMEDDFGDDMGDDLGVSDDDVENFGEE